LTPSQRTIQDLLARTSSGSDGDAGCDGEWVVAGCSLFVVPICSPVVRINPGKKVIKKKIAEIPITVDPTTT